MLKKALLFLLALTLFALALAYLLLAPRISVLNAYVAKNICSCQFVANRDVQTIAEENLQVFPSGYLSTDIDKESKTVSCALFGMSKRVAKYREGLGCALLIGNDDYNCSLQKPKAKALNPEVAWPYGGKTVRAKLNTMEAVPLVKAFDFAFEEQHHTRSLIVVQNDTILKEQYGKGFSKNTPQLGWSMTKNIAGTLVGILQKQGRLNVNDPAPIKAWQADERKKITIGQLLNMGSGLEWEEDYGKHSDVTQCIFLEENAGKFAATKQLEAAPNQIREYSSGSTNIVNLVIRSAFDTEEQYWRFPYEALFYKIGMNSAQLETDESCNYVLSSYCFATPRDWAKYGLLYLHEGSWQGEQIISKEYANYCSSELGLEDDSFYGYGINFVLNTDQKRFPDAPSDTYYTGGFNGQRVIIIPSRNMVIVRTGVCEDFDWNKLLKMILRAIKG